MKKNFIIILVLFFAFGSCEKAEETISNDVTSQNGILRSPGNSNTSMRVFTDYDELSLEIEKTLNFTLEDLIKYEKLIGFNSFGKLADREMMNFLRIGNQMNVESYIANSDFLQIVTIDGDQYCETKYYESPYRYLIDENCMFQVDTMCYKVFENARVGCPIQYYDELLDLQEPVLTRGIIDNGGIVYPSPSYGSTGSTGSTYSGTYVELRATSNDNQRIKTEIYFDYKSYDIVSSGDWYVKSRPYQKVFGIWFWCQRNITHNITLYTPGGFGSDIGTNHDWKREKKLFSVNNEPDIFVTISGIDGTTKIPAATITW